jgi:hypothetical protein
VAAPQEHPPTLFGCRQTPTAYSAHSHHEFIALQRIRTRQSGPHGDKRGSVDEGSNVHTQAAARERDKHPTRSLAERRIWTLVDMLLRCVGKAWHALSIIGRGGIKCDGDQISAPIRCDWNAAAGGR